MTMDFSANRLSYEKGELLESNIPSNPKELFLQWLTVAIEQQVVEPYAMSLATCGNDNIPSVRTVLMREVVDCGDGRFAVVFYSNYDSAKAKDLAENSNAQALFFWHDLERQVRLTGTVEKNSVEKSTNYFHKRPRDSQIAAWVSIPQSGVIDSRPTMENRFSEIKEQYNNDNVVPMPEYWGGYQLIINEVEFWQGRANRMHDRIVFKHTDSQEWVTERLLP